MAGRTNKQGIAAKKKQQKKQANRLKGTKRFSYPKRRLGLEESKQLGIVGVVKNGKGNSYHWFLKGRRVCWETRLKVDPDGYRYSITPSGNSVINEIPISGWVRGKLKSRRS